MERAEESKKIISFEDEFLIENEILLRKIDPKTKLYRFKNTNNEIIELSKVRKQVLLTSNSLIIENLELNLEDINDVKIQGKNVWILPFPSPGVYLIQHFTKLDGKKERKSGYNLATPPNMHELYLIRFLLIARDTKIALDFFNKLKELKKMKNNKIHLEWIKSEAENSEFLTYQDDVFGAEINFDEIKRRSGIPKERFNVIIDELMNHFFYEIRQDKNSKKFYLTDIKILGPKPTIDFNSELFEMIKKNMKKNKSHSSSFG